VLPIIKGSELEGYEDYFVDFMLTFFESKTNRTGREEKVKAFVGWLRNERFTEANLYARFMEKVVAKKKKLGDKERGNRQLAKTMNFQEFRALFKKDEKAFDLKKFKKDFAKEYTRIKSKQEKQLENLKDTVNYKKMLSYSVELECERWFQNRGEE